MTDNREAGAACWEISDGAFRLRGHEHPLFGFLGGQQIYELRSLVYQCRSLPAVDVHGHGSGDFSAFDDGSVKEQIGHRLLVLVHISDLEAQQLRDAPASTHAEREQPAVAYLECAGETR